MDRNRRLFCERARILIAIELKIPPDNIDMISIMRCCERTMRDSCNKDMEERVICLKTKEEEDAVLSEYGYQIIKRIFAGDAPFFDWAQEYERNYLLFLSNQMNDNS